MIIVQTANTPTSAIRSTIRTVSKCAMGAVATTLAKGKDIASPGIRYDARMGIGGKSHTLKNTVIKIKTAVFLKGAGDEDTDKSNCGTLR